LDTEIWTAYSSKTLESLYQFTRCHIPGGWNFHQRRCISNLTQQTKIVDEAWRINPSLKICEAGPQQFSEICNESLEYVFSVQTYTYDAINYTVILTLMERKHIQYKKIISFFVEMIKSFIH
jgi:hypothetical protein